MTHLNSKFSQARQLFFLLAALLSVFHLTFSIETTSHSNDPLVPTQDPIKIDEIRNEIQEINELTLNQFLKINDNAVIYFYAEDCEFCKEFDSTFSEMEKIYNSSEAGKPRKITFGKLKLTEKSQKIFRDFEIDAVPELKYFSKGRASKYAYLFNEYNKRSISRHLSWIERVSRVEEFDQKMALTHRLSIFGNSHDIKQSFYIPEVKSLQEVFDKLKVGRKWRVFVFNCSYEEKQSENKELSIFLKNVYLQELKEEFYCTNNVSLLNSQREKTAKSGNEVFMNVYGLDLSSQKAELKEKISLEAQLLQSSNPSQSLNLIYHSNFISYINKELGYWSTKSAIQVFTRFVFIMNNETKSEGLYEEYRKIKEKLNQNRKIPSIKFYYSDLSATPQQTTRIKKYLFGVEIAVKPTYPYPALAYVKPNTQYIQKFLFPLDQQLTAESMHYWIFKLIKEVENVPEIQLDQKLQETHKNIIVQEYFRTTEDELFPLHYLHSFSSIYHNESYTEEQKLEKLRLPDKFFSNRRQFKYINFADFNILLSTIIKEPIFIFVNCRNDFKSYQLYTQVSEWIEEEEEEEEEEESQQEEIQQQHQEGQQQHQQHVQHKNQGDHVQKKFNPYEGDKKSEKDPKQTDIQIHQQEFPERILAQIQNKNQQHTKENPKQTIYHQDSKVDQQIAVQQTLKQHQTNTNTYQTRDEQIFSKLNLYLLNFNNNDYPPSYRDSERKEHELKIEYFPTFLYFSSDKKVIKKLEGVQSLQQIQNFIAEQLLNPAVTNNRKDEKAVESSANKQEDRSSYDRELEGKAEDIEQSES